MSGLAAVLAGHEPAGVYRWHAAFDVPEVRHTVEQTEAMRPHRGDLDTLIAMSKRGREQLEERLAAERKALAEGRGRNPWQEPHQAPGSAPSAGAPSGGSPEFPQPDKA